ncbi:hypothetical protein XF24_00849 [candidate division SR1 bacterium Aalborg_AAW-1]|nr:hypothetical protein XF24_00849 [candidate division SR1 bacterium Aalborg_AAW-1]
MTGDQYILELLSGQNNRISQIEKTLGTGNIVMEIKSELGNEYKEIIQIANGGLSSQITWTNGLISVMSVLVPLIVAGIGIYFKNNIEKKIIEVKELEKNIKELHDLNKKQGEIIDTQLLEMSNIQKKIESQDTRIYNHIMETMTNYRFDRLKENPGDRDNLQPNILVLDENLVRKRKENYEILLACLKESYTNYCAIYQFFPDKLFGEKLINQRINEKKSINFPSEIIKSTKLIFNYYINNKNNDLQSEMKIYLEGLRKNIINNNIYKQHYGPIKQEQIKEFINNNIKNIGEQEMRNNIKNPPKIEIIEGETQQKK